MTDSAHANSDLLSAFAQQRQRFMQTPFTTASQRQQQLLALKQQLLAHVTPLTDALNLDYGQRASYDTLWADIQPVLSMIDYSRKRLRRWMQPSKRHAGVLLAPAKVSVHYQAKGVVGIIVPWNFPVMLSLGPLVSALAAGNRVMLKLSEFTPATNQVLRQLLQGAFSAEHVTVVEGGVEVAQAFSALPFDHLLFTGATSVGKQVMAAAANNLTPVTLELGGKSPVLIDEQIPMALAVQRLIFGKTLNAGQICVAPDYVLCPAARVPEFIAQYRQLFAQHYPHFSNNADVSFIVSERHRQRLSALLDDARAKGAQCVSACPIEPQQLNTRAWPTQLLTKVSDDMQVMQQEIFGPILPIVGYDNIEQALDYINQRPRPLALYLMSEQTALQQRVMQHTHAGALSINETLMHVAVDDAPFGGVGASGMGHYHGVEGFREFSHAKTVFRRGRISPTQWIKPPYGGRLQQWLKRFILR